MAFVIKLSEQMDTELKEYSKASLLTKSVVIRLALRDFFKKENEVVIINITKELSQIVPDDTKIEVTYYSSGPYFGVYYAPGIVKIRTIEVLE